MVEAKYTWCCTLCSAACCDVIGGALNCVDVVVVVQDVAVAVAAAAMAAASSPADVRVLLRMEVFFLLLRFLERRDVPAPWPWWWWWWWWWWPTLPSSWSDPRPSGCRRRQLPDLSRLFSREEVRVAEQDLTVAPPEQIFPPSPMPDWWWERCLPWCGDVPPSDGFDGPPPALPAAPPLALADVEMVGSLPRRLWLPPPPLPTLPRGDFRSLPSP